MSSLSELLISPGTIAKLRAVLLLFVLAISLIKAMPIEVIERSGCAADEARPGASV